MWGIAADCHTAIEEIAELCALCTTEDGSTGALLESVFSFMLTKTARVALPKLSAVERGTLTLQLISAGGLQHDACRRFLFQELSPPYSTTVLVLQSHEFYLRPAERMLMPDDNDDMTVLLRRKKYFLPLLSLLHNGGAVERAQPPVDFRGKNVEHLLYDLIRLWNTTSLKSLPPLVSLGELPPGLAAYIVLHYPARTLRLLQTTVVRPSVPSTWRHLWRQFCFSAVDSDDITGSMHTLLDQGICADFWPLTLRALVYPLAGNVTGGDGAEGDQPMVFDGPSIFVTHAMLYLWLSEIKRECGGKGVGLDFSSTETVGGTTTSAATTTASALDFSSRRALAYGLSLVEKDAAYCCSGEMKWGRAGVVQAAYGLLLSLYHGHSMASHYVRSALDHPEVTLFVPSFADLSEEKEGGQLGGEERSCSSLKFITALALRLPVAQLYIAERVWCLLESMVAPGGEDGREIQRTELDARLQVLLNIYTFSGLPLEVVQKKSASSPPSRGLTVSSSSLSLPSQDPKKCEDGPRLTLRLKRTRAGERSPQRWNDNCSNNSGDKQGDISVKNNTGVPPKDSDISLAAVLLCDALFDFAVEELVQLPTPVYSSASLSTVAATFDSQLPINTMRLVLVTPSHMRSLLDLVTPSSFSSSSSSLPPCSAALRDVCCVLMSVLLYRQCHSLQRWLSREAKGELRTAVTGRLLWRLRHLLRFFAPLGVYRYPPVADVLLPECLRGMEEEEVELVKGEENGGTCNSAAATKTPNTALAELCGVVRAALS